MIEVAARIVGLFALGVAAVLVVLDLTQGGFLNTEAHAVLSAAPLGLIAFAYLAHQAVRKLSWMEGLQAALLAAAFLCWSVYQLFPTFAGGPVFNDVAIALFVLDVAFILNGRLRSTTSDPFQR